MEIFAQIIMAAIFIEAVIEIIKGIIVDKKIDTWQIVSIAVAILFCIAYQLDALAILGFNTGVPYLGMIFTGIVVSRGSNFVSDLFGKLNDWKKNIGTVDTEKTEDTETVEPKN